MAGGRFLGSEQSLSGKGGRFLGQHGGGLVKRYSRPVLDVKNRIRSIAGVSRYRPTSQQTKQQPTGRQIKKKYQVSTRRKQTKRKTKTSRGKMGKKHAGSRAKTSQMSKTVNRDLPTRVAHKASEMAKTALEDLGANIGQKATHVIKRGLKDVKRNVKRHGKAFVKDFAAAVPTFAAAVPRAIGTANKGATRKLSPHTKASSSHETQFMRHYKPKFLSGTKQYAAGLPRLF